MSEVIAKLHAPVKEATTHSLPLFPDFSSQCSFQQWRSDTTWGHFVDKFFHVSFFSQMVNSIAFSNFSFQRSVPYRVCDFYDEVRLLSLSVVSVRWLQLSFFHFCSSPILLSSTPPSLPPPLPPPSSAGCSVHNSSRRLHHWQTVLISTHYRTGTRATSLGMYPKSA